MGMTGHTGGEAWVIGGRAKLVQVEAVVGGLGDIRYRQRVRVVLQCKPIGATATVCTGTALACAHVRESTSVRACVRVCVCVFARAFPCVRACLCVCA